MSTRGAEATPTVSTLDDRAAGTSRGVELDERQPGGSPLIVLEGLEKVYRMGRVDYRALRGVDLSVAAGEIVAVVGRAVRFRPGDALRYA